MSMEFKKRSQFLGPDYWEGKGDGKTATATPYTDIFGNKGYTVDEYNHNTGESNTYDVTHGTNFLGNDYIHVNQTSHSVPASSESSDGGLGILAAIILVPFLFVLPVIIWQYAVFDSFQNNTVEPVLCIIAAVIGGILSLCTACKDYATITESFLTGTNVCALLLGISLACYYYFFDNHSFFASLCLCLFGGIVGFLLGIIPCIICSIIGRIINRFSEPKKS